MEKKLLVVLPMELSTVLDNILSLPDIWHLFFFFFNYLFFMKCLSRECIFCEISQDVMNILESLSNANSDFLIFIFIRFYLKWFLQSQRSSTHPILVNRFFIIVREDVVAFKKVNKVGFSKLFLPTMVPNKLCLRIATLFYFRHNSRNHRKTSTEKRQYLPSTVPIPGTI